MDLHLYRFSGGKDDTLGLLFLGNKFAAFTLEDEKRTIKVMGETRIPAGTYEIFLRNVGGLTKSYGRRFPDIHKGMLWLQDVPDFQYIYIHCGNRDEDTEGCILIGDTSQQNITEDGFIGASVAAYRRVYPQIVEALDSGARVFIHIYDEVWM